MRAAINFGNTVLARRGPTLDESGGVTVEIARELARRLNVPLELVPFDGAGAVVAVASDDVFDVAFMAVDPLREKEVRFTAPYVLIEGGYMVRERSPLTAVSEVDRPGIRVAVGEGSAYDLYPSRTLKNANIIRASTSQAAVALFESDDLEVAAGVKMPLVEYAATHPGLRMLPGSFHGDRTGHGDGARPGRLAHDHRLDRGARRHRGLSRASRSRWTAGCDGGPC